MWKASDENNELTVHWKEIEIDMDSVIIPESESEEKQDLAGTDPGDVNQDLRLCMCALWAWDRAWVKHFPK
jgi:hypothetical protein